MFATQTHSTAVSSMWITTYYSMSELRFYQPTLLITTNVLDYAEGFGEDGISSMVEKH